MKLSPSDIWSATVNDLQVSLSKAYFESYIKKVSLVNIEYLESDLPKVTLSCQSAFHQLEITRKCLPTIKETLESIISKPVSLDLVIDTRVPEIHSQEQGPLFAQIEDTGNSFEEVLKKVGFRPEYTLDNFAVSSSNEMAYAAAKAVAANPGFAYNPLFLYGGVGVGKTHLMQGVGMSMLQKDLDTKIIYCTGEEFTNAIIDAIRQKSTPKFRRRYRSVKLLLIDDIQFIAGKNAVQEEFFHTFNSITKEGGQVIMTSDKPPKEIDFLEDRLRSRFEGGLTIDIGNPNFELRTAILMIKAAQLKVALPQTVAHLIASPEQDTRAMLGKLVTVITLASTRKKPLTVEFAQEVLGKDVLKTPSTKIITPTQIIEAVSSTFDLPKQDILGPKRVKQLALARHMAMFLLKDELKLGYVEIGRIFGGRDHTSIMHAVKKIEAMIVKDNQIKSQVAVLKDELYQ